MILITKFLFLAASVPVALAACSLKWEPCAKDDYLGSECSTFTVPIDYLDMSSNNTITLQVTRVPAVKESQGNIFVNFGGPGFATRDDLVMAAEELMVITGGNYDLIGLDPSDDERLRTIPKLRLNDAWGVNDKVALARMWASVGNVANDCVDTTENAPKMGALVGTGYAARDMMLLNDVLNGPDALLNYYGVSYGTILGATTAALFPERMGRVLLSSNVNLAEWYDGYDLVWWSDADKAVFDFFERCVKAGTDLCALAIRNETAAVLDAKMYQLMDELRLDPIPVDDALVLDSSALKMAFRGILMGNQPWPMFATVLNELFKPAAERNLETVSEVWHVLSSATKIIGNLQDQSMFGIYCGDKAARAASFEEIFAISQQLVEISKALGEVANNLVYLCARWPYHAKGGYEGGWNDVIETANPILFTGSRYDHVTPLGNAYNSSRIFAGSAVLPHNGIGHGVTTHPSLCTARAMRAYFQNGTLPADDLNCTADFDAFDTTKTWRDSYLPELSLERLTGGRD